MRHVLAALVTLALVLGTGVGHADIFRWDNGLKIPGTKGITPGPSVDLNNWNTSAHNLKYANLAGLSLPGASFSSSWLDYAHFQGANLNSANLTDANLANANLSNCTLTVANLTGANLGNAQLSDSTLTSANLTGAMVAGARLDGTHGFTAAQLYSTQSYAAKDLSGIDLGGNDLTDWDFHDQNLTNAQFGSGTTLTRANLTEANLANANLQSSTLTAANLTGAILANAKLNDSTLADANVTGATVAGARLDGAHGFTAAQLYSTRSYTARDLSGIGLGGNDLTDWDFHEQNLAGANFYNESGQYGGSNLSNANLTGANLANAIFSGRKSGYPGEYGGSNLTNANLTGANLVANFSHCRLASANLTGAVVAGASFSSTTPHGFTAAQLYSTQSYAAKDLRGIGLGSNDLRAWDFHEQNLAGANFSDYNDSGDYNGSDLAIANLTGANLANANFSGYDRFGDPRGSNLASASLTGANLAGANLSYSGLSSANLTDANLTNANLSYSTLTGADLTGADTRGAQGLNWLGAHSHNTISPDGTISGLTLADEQLLVRDPPRSPIPITVQNHLTMADGGVLELRFDADRWDSLISFAPGIPVQLGGTLDLTFAKDADPASQVGHRLRLFNWTGVSPSGHFTVSSLYSWDLSNLYTMGQVTLLAAGIAGDANGDGKVDTADFATLKDHFGAAGSTADGDANGDGRVDLADFGILKANFGKGAAAVPEPATVVLAVLGLALALLAQRRVLVRTAVLPSARISRPLATRRAF